MSVWFFLLSMLARSGSCEMINGDQISGADLARALPAFSSIPRDAVIGYSPAPGGRRVFTFPELEGIAKKYGVVAPRDSKACFEWALQPLNEDAVRAAIRESLASSGSARRSSDHEQGAGPPRQAGFSAVRTIRIHRHRSIDTGDLERRGVLP